MAYMSYCKYEGSYYELNRCLYDVEEHVNEESEFEVSKGEIQWFRNIVERVHEFLCDQELLDENGDLQMSRLDEICEAMSKKYDPGDYGN